MDQDVPTKGAMRILKNVRIVAEKPMDNAPRQSPKIPRALFQSNSSLNHGVYDLCSIGKNVKEPDKLELFEAAHKPKRLVTKLDDASAAALDAVQTKLDGLPGSSRSDRVMPDKIYEEIVGEDKNGYAKTYVLGIKVPRSHEKRCAMAIERERRVKGEEDLENMTVKLQEIAEKVERAQHKAERHLIGLEE
ncbi:hypothetical protein Cgig2_028484 [Carnegiea gigantea]|uniref:Uncharacterized protein n=1 Tax=Carnegiea gigantea TaxID=171969 RepID=A0A9Q1JM07_9CARY|nr:hypothetical protein Cgig2_028484 [Carnegiea gigantea]